jgi:alpha-amylase
MDQADEFADLGITCIWLPPPTDSVSPQGYMPGDLYNLNSKYGSQEDLKRSVKSSVRGSCNASISQPAR